MARFLNKIFILSILCLFSCDEQKIEKYDLYFGGDILTMSSDMAEYVSAVVTDKSSGKIIYVGEIDQAQKLFPHANKIDIKGAVLLPGFIDAHAHFTGFPAQAIGAQILPPPDATVDSIAKLIMVLNEWATPENIALTGWIFGMGFDDSVILEKRFPTRYELDKISQEIPVAVIHISGHLAAVNSKALEILGYNADTPDPAGGTIRRFKDSTEPNGVLEELAIIPFLAKYLGPKTPEAALKFLESGQDLALSYGYTTIQEGRAFENSHDFIKTAAQNKLLKLDVVSYIDHTAAHLLESEWYSKSYIDNYRIAGLKLSLDGSPQGRTAWLTTPYLIPPEGADKSYRGYPAIAALEEVIDIYDMAYRNNWQILTHANGDAAMDQMIAALKIVTQKYPQQDRRNVLIHGQYVRFDQLDEYKKLDIIASLFPLHTFYWGDWHKKLIGADRGNNISPTRTALDKGLIVTIHTDAPVALPNLMRLVWTASKRESRSGAILGKQQRLTPYEALRAITYWGAYQHFEEHNKGSITVGKLADLVIMDKNPLKVDLDQIKEIKILKTIKNGQIIYNYRSENS